MLLTVCVVYKTHLRWILLKVRAISAKIIY